MAIRSVPQIVLDEADDVLGELTDWLRVAPYCPHCLALRGCSHAAGCPLSRVARLRCLFGSGDQQHRDEELAALQSERGELVTPERKQLPRVSRVIDLPLPMSVHFEAGAPDQSPVSSVRRFGDAASRGEDGESDAARGEPRELAADAPMQIEAVDDADARAFVIETLQLAATRCFAEASAMRGRADPAPAGPLRATAAALCHRAGRYAEAAAGWLTRNGADALLGQGALLRAFARDADPIAEPEGARR